MDGIEENEIFSEKIGTEAGQRWSDVLYKGEIFHIVQLSSNYLFSISRICLFIH